MRSLDLIRLDDKMILTEFEEELFKKVRIIYNKESGKDKLSEELFFRCDFIEKETPLNANDMVNKWKFEISINANSVIDYILANNPDLTKEEAQKQMEENSKINEQYRKQQTESFSNNGAVKAANQPA